MKLSVMLDTNVFNHILGDEKIIEAISKKLNVFATHIQRDEILKIKDKDAEKRKKLLSLFQELTVTETPTESYVVGTSRIEQSKITGNVIPTESSVWGISSWGECKWSQEEEFNLYERILQELNGKNKSKKNNKEDALIAETAIKNKLILVTHDSDLFSVVTMLGGSASNIFSLVDAEK